MGLLTTVAKVILWFIINLIIIIVIFPFWLAKPLFQLFAIMLNTMVTNFARLLAMFFNAIVDFVNQYLGLNWQKINLNTISVTTIEVIPIQSVNIPSNFNSRFGLTAYPFPLPGQVIYITPLDLLFLFVGVLVLVYTNKIYFEYVTKLIS